MNSDFFNLEDKIVQINNSVMPLASYTPKLNIVAGAAQGIQDDSVTNNTVRYEKAYTDADSIKFDQVTFNSTERKHMHVSEKRYEFFTGLKIVKFNISERQNQEAINEAISKGITKASVQYDMAILNGADNNRGILDPANATTLDSVAITNVDILIKTLESMKVQLMENNLSTDGFKALIPVSLKPLIEASLSFTITGADRVYKSIGSEGVDFEYVPGFVDGGNNIIMSYAPQVLWLFTYTPQVLGSYVSLSGSAVDSFNTIEMGYGTTAIHSLNGNKAILVQPFTTA